MSAFRKIALFGSTGSIGVQTLQVLEASSRDEVVLLAARNNWQRLAEQANKFRPSWICIENQAHYAELKKSIDYAHVEISAGKDAVAAGAAMAGYDLCVNGLVGVAGLMPSYHALQRGIDVALANKESLVLAGALLKKIASKNGAQLLPIDSEHSAIMQCLQGESNDWIKRIILTASGGPFRTWSLSKIANATVDEALNHPTWKMGAKITVDSATLLNKGLEVIEAYHLFDVPVEKIDVRIHPVSVVHSMVEFQDGSFKAQLGTPDMRLPIRYALSYPERIETENLTDDPLNWPPLEFFEIEPERYPCLELSFKALEQGGTACAVLNGADEAAVDAFLNGAIRFGRIAELIAETLSAHKNSAADSLKSVQDADGWARDFVLDMVGQSRKAAV
ncbi:1-deoxy-D-xylulose-5-phosphate reductoisomerase [Calditrichota bacterium]